MTMLPAPPLPVRSPSAVDAATLAAVVGEDAAEPLRRIEDAHERARQAIRELRDHRPGHSNAFAGVGTADGPAWTEAAKADAADAAEGRIPEDGWRTARLLASDADRWADARTAVGALPLVRQRAEAELDRQAIAETAAGRSGTHATKWGVEAERGWTNHGSPAVAWQHAHAGQTALAEWQRAQAVRRWALREGTMPAASVRPDLSGASYLPEDNTARGYWLALWLVLRPGQVWQSIPKGVIFPDDMPDKLLHDAFPGGQRQADLVVSGYHSAKS